MAEIERHSIRIDRQGRASIPKSLRESMGLGDGGEVRLDVRVRVIG
jgi:AbrB family looped-hinge helix DNA binding protein